MRTERFYPHEETVTLVAATEKLVTIKGPNIPGTTRVRWDFFSHDETKVAGGTVQDLRAKILPKGNSEAMGGNVYQTPYAAPTPGTNNRNAIHLGGFTTAPNEDVDVYLLSATGGTFVIRFERTLLGAFPD